MWTPGAKKGMSSSAFHHRQVHTTTSFQFEDVGDAVTVEVAEAQLIRRH
jgi:hypothetical protein